MRRSQKVQNFKSPIAAVSPDVRNNHASPNCLDINNSIFNLVELPETPNVNNKNKTLGSPFSAKWSSTKKKNISLNDALSESSLNFAQIFDSPFLEPLNEKSSRHKNSQNLNNSNSVELRAKKRLNEVDPEDENLHTLQKYPKYLSPKHATLGLTVTETPISSKSKILPVTTKPTQDTDFIELNATSFSPTVSQRYISRIKSTTIQFSQVTGAHYVQLQRSMVTKNEENIVDDDIAPADNSMIYTTQFRRDVEEFIDNCERTIIEQKLETKDNQEDLLNGFSTIDWDDDDFEQNVQNKISGSVNKTQSALGNHKLAPISSCTFPELGPFFGLPNKVKTLIKEFKGIDELYDWQRECLRLKSILQRTNLIYALPTSGGKTLVAEILMLREVICRKKNVIFILPYVSIVQEKVMALAPFAVNFEFLVEEYAAGKGVCPPKKRRKKKSIFIATIEKGLALLDSLIAENRGDEIGLIVVDELHLIGEEGRGGSLEIFLTKAMLINCGIQIIGMSATIGNLNEVAEFLNADVYTRDFRPVELKEYIKIDCNIMEVNANSMQIEEAFTLSRVVNYNYSTESKKIDPDHLVGLVQETIPKDSCLIFCPTKQNCENVATLLCNMLTNDLMMHRSDEKSALLAAIEKDVGTICPVLKQTIPYGIAYHHSGLTSDERKHLEDAFRLGILCVLCCTSTLAAGVNLPAKRVILRSPYVGKSFLTLSRYKQMVGRAGRAGQTEYGESILICNSKDLPRIQELLFSPMDEAKSSLAIEETFGLQTFVLSVIDLGLAKNRDELQKIVQKTMLYIQADRLNVKVKERIDETLKNLYKTNALSLISNGTPTILTAENSIVIENTQNVLQETSIKGKKRIKGKTQLEISRLGKAAIKACITLTRAHTLYKDLVEASKHLTLVNYLHLLYLATPYDTVENNAIDPNAYYEAYKKLNDNERLTANVIGLTEARARQIVLRKKIDEEITRKLNRFYITLILYDLWFGKSVQEVHVKFKIGRGIVQSLMQNAATHASSILRFSEELDEFWAFKQLFDVFTKRLAHCCSLELLPLMELPSVKIGRAKQLYVAGYKKLEDLAKATSEDLVQNIEHMSYKLAKQLISAAKALLLEQVENLRGQIEEVMENFQHKL